MEFIIFKILNEGTGGEGERGVGGDAGILLKVLKWYTTGSLVYYYFIENAKIK